MIDPLADLALFDLRVLAIEAGPLLALALALAAGLARRAPPRRAARDAGGGGRREPARRGLASEGGGGGARSRRGGERGQIAVSGDDEPRNPHAAQRHPRHGRPACATPTLDPEHASYVEAIRGSGAALANLIDQILDFSKIEAGRLELVREAFDLRKLVESIVELLAPQAQGKGLEIAASIAADAPRFVVGDSLRLRQALTNLAGNAVKFTQRGGVGVSVERTARRPRAVQGRWTPAPAFPLDRRAAIFEDFEQGDGSNARHYEGTGLGLAISKRIVALMGGELVLADNPGGGSIFSFAIPLPARADAPPEAAPVTLTGRRALIVAHSPFEAPAIAARLGEAGAAVARAEGLEDGLAALARRPEAGPRHHRLRPRRRGDQSPGARGARRRGAQEPGAVLAVRAARLRPEFAAGVRRLAGQAGARPLAVRSSGERVRARRERAGAGARRSRPAARAMRALLAEDNDINAVVAQKALRRLGLRGRARARRRRGDAARRRRDARAIASFRRHPDGHQDAGHRRLRSGARAFAALERETGAPRAALVALTANAMAEDRRASAAAGFDEFLAKPVDLARLAETIERLLADARAARFAGARAHVINLCD